jgi:hypothetical protein
MQPFLRSDAPTGSRTKLSLIGAVLAMQLCLATAASAQLVNPGFDSGPPGAVGNFALVVGPPFQDGFWGAETSSIVTQTVCSTAPRSGPYMLEMAVRADSQTEAWQAVDVTGNPPTVLSLSAWANSCATAANPTVGVEIRTYNDVNGWPTHTFVVASSIQLDTNSSTWEPVSMECTAIPSDTEWILVRVFFVNSTMGGQPGYIDDVELVLDCPTPIIGTTWGSIKSVTGSGGR